MTRHCIILNPWAGRGLAGKRRDALEQALRTANVPYDLVTTHARGGATELTYQAIERGYTHIVAAGGDGTINEVVNGIMGNQASGGPGAILGIIPLGTGSDFVKVLDGFVPNDLDGAVQRLEAGRTRAVDLGQARVASAVQECARAFINALGIGLDAQVAVESQKITRLKGLAVYLVAVIRALAGYKAHPMTVRFDDQLVRRRLLFASVANGRCQGGGFWMTPDALIDDGMLDVCMVNKLRLDQIIRYLPNLLEGTHTHIRHVTMGRARQIIIECAAPVPVATDGEIVATDARRVDIEVLPGAIEVVV